MNAQPTFDQVTANSRSMLIVQNKATAVELYERFRKGVIPYQTCLVYQREHAQQQLDLWHRNALGYRFGVFISLHPIMMCGVRLACDKIIWIGEVPDLHDQRWNEYAQAIRRGMPGTPTFSYGEHEL